MTKFIDSLPADAVNCDYRILSPEHGFAPMALPLLTGGLTSVILNVEFSKWHSMLHVSLAGAEVFIDPKRHSVLHVSSVTGEFLDFDGGETGRFVNAYFYLIMSVTDADTPAGTIRMWGQYDARRAPTEPKE